MLTSWLTPELLAQIQAGAIVVLILIVFVGSLLFIRQLHSLRQALVGLSTTHQSTQSLIEQRHTTSQEQVHQLQIAQASTQATVLATQQEMQHLMRDLTTLQRDAQNLMRELKTQQDSTQAFMADWKMRGSGFATPNSSSIKIA